MEIAAILPPKALSSTHKCPGHCNPKIICDWSTVLWGPKLKLFWRTTGPKSALLSAPFLLLTWTPHYCVLKGAESRAVLGAVGCENSFHFSSPSTPIHSQVHGALQCPNHVRRDHSALGPKLKLFWHTTGPKSARLAAPFLLLMWYPHCCVLKEAESRVVLGALGCENSFNFACKSTLIHSQVPGALQSPNHL